MANYLSDDVNSPRMISDLFETTKKWLDEAGGAYDLMNAVKRICAVCGFTQIQNRSEGYLDVAAVPRLPCVTVAAIQTLHRAGAEPLTPQVAIDVSHHFFDVGSTACYALAFFKKQTQSVLKMASVFDVLADTTDLGSCVCRYRDHKNKESQTKRAPFPIQRVAHHEKLDSLLNIIRAITAVALSILACSIALTGILFVPAMLAGIVAIANSTLIISIYYHKNYWCKDLLSF